jgi:hypothetical protein
MHAAIDSILRQNDGLQKSLEELEQRLVRPSNMPTGSLRRRILALRIRIAENEQRVSSLANPMKHS